MSSSESREKAESHAVFEGQQGHGLFFRFLRHALIRSRCSSRVNVRLANGDVAFGLQGRVHNLKR